jgi:hypothetical protein
MKVRHHFTDVLLALFLALLCGNAAALEIRFSGIITEATPGRYGVEVGDRFSGYLLYDPEIFASSGGLGLAVIDIETDEPTPDILFFHPSCTLTAFEGAYYLLGNPYDFFGSLYILVDEAGSTIGGELALSSEPGRDNGSFRGVINVPDAASSIGLLALGLIAIAFWRRLSRAA